jgi:hypothetical protein
MGMAGEPITASLGATSRVTPLCPAMRAPLPIVRWPTIPT